MKRKQPEYQAFIDLVFEHQGILHRICAVYTSAQEDREDLYQDILLQSWRSFESFRNDAKFSTWLYRVALNTALLRRRKESRKQAMTMATDVRLEDVVPDAPPVEADAELLHECIRQLPTLDRAIILLYLERHSYEEMAEVIGLSKSNISVRLVRIKTKLRQLLLARGYREGCADER